MSSSAQSSDSSINTTFGGERFDLTQLSNRADHCSGTILTAGGGVTDQDLDKYAAEGDLTASQRGDGQDAEGAGEFYKGGAIGHRGPGIGAERRRNR